MVYILPLPWCTFWEYWSRTFIISLCSLCFRSFCGFQRWLQTPWESKGAETSPKDSLLHSPECKEHPKYGTFNGILENDNYQLQYDDVGCRVLGSNGILKKDKAINSCEISLWTLSGWASKFVSLKRRYWWLNTVTCVVVTHLGGYTSDYHLIGAISLLNVFFPSPTPPRLFHLKSIINNAWSNINVFSTKLTAKSVRAWL